MAVVGIDEVGRGVWAGPFVVAGVRTPSVLPEWWTQLKDSKVLSDKRRRELCSLLAKDQTPCVVFVYPPSMVDSVGLSELTRSAVHALAGALAKPGDTVVVDGSTGYGYKAVVKAESKFREVAAASIIAKVRRDDLMGALHFEYPAYGFSRHVGYGTPEHRAALDTWGPIPGVHRWSVRPVRELVGG